MCWISYTFIPIYNTAYLLLLYYSYPAARTDRVLRLYSVRSTSCLYHDRVQYSVFEQEFVTSLTLTSTSTSTSTPSRICLPYIYWTTFWITSYRSHTVHPNRKGSSSAQTPGNSQASQSRVLSHLHTIKHPPPIYPTPARDTVETQTYIAPSAYTQPSPPTPSLLRTFLIRPSSPTTTTHQ